MRLANERPNHLAVASLQVMPHDTLLELGFGPGHALELMARLVPHGRIYGVDHSRVMLEQASKRNQAAMREGRVVLFRAGCDALPLENASIDKVLAVNVIYFWQDVGAVLKEIRRVLRPGGRVSIYATDADSMRKWKFAGPETHRLYSADQLTNVMRQAGFERRAICVKKMRIAGRIQGLIVTLS